MLDKRETMEAATTAHVETDVKEASLDPQLNVDGVSNNKYSRTSKRLISFLVVLVAVIVAVIGLTIVAIQNQKGNDAAADSFTSGNNNNDKMVDPEDNTDTSSSNNSGEDGETETDDIERFDQVVAFLSDNEISSKTNLLSSNTPQHKAANFMATVDEYDIPETIADTSYQFIQRYVMAVFYYAMDGDNWIRSANFVKASNDTCEWNIPVQLAEPVPTIDAFTDFDYGVSCYDPSTSNYGDRVTYIFLPYNNLVGSIPTEIAWLPNLVHFSVFNNKIGGAIPDAFSEFEFLEYWNMENNRVTGTLPSYLNQLNALQYLELGNNTITGILPSFVDSNLIELSLDKNDLEGSIDALNDAVLLEVLYVNDNSFTGTLSSNTLSALTDLSIIDLSLNELKGSFPSHFYLVDEIDLSRNALTGTIAAPENTPTAGFPISYLNLADNLLKGSIPNAIGFLTNLIALDVSNNDLTGVMPSELGLLTQLESLYLSYNDGFTPGPIPDLRYSNDMLELSMASTNRDSFLPHWLGVYTNLQLLDLHDNALTSSIPTTLTALESLKALLLNHNFLEGDVPTELGTLENLETLYLDQNAGLVGDMSPICNNTAKGLAFITVDDNVICDCCTSICDLQTDAICNILSFNLVLRLEDTNTITHDAYVLSAEMILETAPLK